MSHQEDILRRRLDGFLLARPVRQKPQYFTLQCMSAKLRFLKNRNAIAHDLEPAPFGGPHLDLYVLIAIPDLSRQTGGSRLIVSKSAVLDRNLHCRASPVRVP